jgi:lysyl endopeptidase
MRHKLLVCLLLVLCTSVFAGSPELQKVGDTVDARIESPHPVSGFWRQDVDVPGASFLKLHLADMQLGEGDLLLVTDAYGLEAYSVTGPASQLGWLPSVDGDHLTLEIWPAKGSAAHGITVDKVAQGLGVPTPESICGVDDSRDAACYQSDAGKWTAGDAVGRMLFQMSNGGWYLCTGSLVSQYNHFLTNNHCIEDEHAASTLEVRWRYQYSACSGGTLGTASVSNGAHLLVTNVNLDFSLVTLCNDTPAQRYGYLQLNPTLPNVGDVLWIPQHPGGNPKRFAVVSDMDSGGNAKVQAVNLDGVVAGGHTDIGYFADTQGGSSGSPVLDANNKVIALHHYGIAGSGSCTGSNMNQGVEMSKVYPLISSMLTSASSCSGPTPPSITSIKTVTSPAFVLKLSGTNFHSGCTIKINGTAVPVTQFMSDILIKAKGAGLKTMVPKGVQVMVTVVNNDDGGVSASFPYKR